VKKILILATLFALCFDSFMVAPASANKRSVSAFDNLDANIDIVAVNAILISKSSSVIKIFVTISNNYDKKLQIKGRLQIIINPDDKPVDPNPCFALIAQKLNDDEKNSLNTRLVLGKTDAFKADLNACEQYDSEGDCVKPGETLCLIEIPYKSYQVVGKLVNYLGFPGSKKEIKLQGKLEIFAIGKQKTNRFKYEVDFKIPSRIQSEVLIRKKY